MKTQKAETVIRDLFSLAGVTVGGNKPYDIRVHNNGFYQRVLSNATLGMGESYMEQWWDCDAIDQLIDRLLRADLEYAVRGNWRVLWPMLQSKLLNMQTRSRAFEVGERHYDLGNDLYEAMLDKRMNYTCAYWKDSDNLDDAQEAKLELVCRKIGLQPGMTILELGCGFGCFAGYAAEKYGATIKGVTVSKEQAAYANERYKHLPVEILLEDYRNVDGKYDRVISIGLMEHIGYRNYGTYMDVVARTLKKNGIAFVHAIGRNDFATTTNPWSAKYIFPNSVLPSIAGLAKAMEQHFVVEDWHNFGPDYDRTAMVWCDRFEDAWPELKKNYDERFHRMFRYYLRTSAGGFRARQTQLWQIVMTRIGQDRPDCRLS